MNKRSAMTIAAGLAAALLAGFAAFSLSFGNPATPAAASAKSRKPIVRTIERTVTIHKKAKDAPSSSVRVVTLPAPSSVSGVTAGYAGDDQYESEGSGDDGFGSSSSNSGEWSGGGDD